MIELKDDKELTDKQKADKVNKEVDESMKNKSAEIDKQINKANENINKIRSDVANILQKFHDEPINGKAFLQK